MHMRPSCLHACMHMSLRQAHLPARVHAYACMSGPPACQACTHMPMRQAPPPARIHLPACQRVLRVGRTAARREWPWAGRQQAHTHTGFLFCRVGSALDPELARLDPGLGGMPATSDPFRRACLPACLPGILGCMHPPTPLGEVSGLYMLNPLRRCACAPAIRSSV